MHRTVLSIFFMAQSVFISAANDQGNGAAVEAYFTGKQVVLKIDMPGTQKGVDLKFNKPSPMDWKEYSSRLKQFGAAIHKGDTVRVTSIVVG